MNKVFDEKQKKVLVEELDKVIKDWIDYLEDNDNDEDARCNRLFPLIWLQNLIKTGIIDRLEISEEEEDKIYS